MCLLVGFLLGGLLTGARGKGEDGDLVVPACVPVFDVIVEITNS